MKKRLLILGVVIAACILPVFVSAQAAAPKAGFVPLTKDTDFQKIFGMNSANAGTGINDLTTFINAAFKITLSLGAILAVLRIGYAGYQYMSSDAWGEKSHAKEILGDVVIGLLLLLSVYLILNQINPQLTQLKIEYITKDNIK